ncbi:hypothetical protein TTHERM_000628339 (macronuclear) [Tetrahymena thermophila SB210]|uniref:Uncharacterized protein n=1 Tax=Tetrahymena thermophila (strain SB210) TaxID=312017 RepID=W7XAT8_TETTS|nr:hypothetical protein TTHERM_000628339 [Tetrahymena thermophila SB210]EWS73533.1 hypothetical protein TTHERM_000628339 [Tetrahymena thermophila SB210]|eukprot:XP_012653923.1 hypothetical protein TTHERM_000628339 [Tetrahymena thermophila SB210]
MVCADQTPNNNDKHLQQELHQTILVKQLNQLDCKLFIGVPLLTNAIEISYNYRTNSKIKERAKFLSNDFKTTENISTQNQLSIEFIYKARFLMEFIDNFI